VATRDGTTVVFTTTVAANNWTVFPNTPTVVALNRGEAYQVLAVGPGAMADLTGSTVQADQPVAVFGANTCAYVPVAAPGTCDLAVEQIVPTSSLGTEFVVMPSSGRSVTGDQVKVLASVDSTVVTMVPSPSGCCPPVDAGEHFEVTVAEPTHITANHPVQIARLAASAIPDFVTPPGDPFQAEVLPVGEFTNRHRFLVDNFGGGSDFSAWVDVVTTSTECVFLDGRQIPPASFAGVGATPYLATSVQISPGPHVLESQAASGVTVYGFALSEGFGTVAPGHSAAVACDLFANGFEAGDTSAWSSAVP
jgi:hypothetical protein